MFQKNKNKEKQLTKKVTKLFYLTPERRKKVYEQIKEQSNGDFDYFLLTIFSGIVVTLGLLIDSAAVVIGGMILAPLFWPILGLAVGIVKGRPQILQKSIFTIAKSVILILLIAILLGLIVPDLVVINNEFTSRTSATLFELLIALASGFIGAFIIAYPKLGSSLAGVVIATAIVSPLAVMGLSIAGADFNGAFGAGLLFASNLIAITFSAVLLFFFCRFATPGEKAEEQRAVGVKWTALFLVIIIVPLVFATQQTILTVKINKVVTDVLASSLENVSISSVKINQLSDQIKIDATIQYNHNLTAEEVAAIENIINKRLNKITYLNVRVIPVVKAGNEFQFVNNGVTNQAVEVTQEPVANQEKNIELVDFIKCPVVINNKKITRVYPIEVGCPICPKIISCGDGREFPSQVFNQKTDLCDDVVFDSSEPCLAPVVVDTNVEDLGTNK